MAAAVPSGPLVDPSCKRTLMTVRFPRTSTSRQSLSLFLSLSRVSFRFSSFIRLDSSFDSSILRACRRSRLPDRSTRLSTRVRDASRAPTTTHDHPRMNECIEFESNRAIRPDSSRRITHCPTAESRTWRPCRINHRSCTVSPPSTPGSDRSSRRRRPVVESSCAVGRRGRSRRAGGRRRVCGCGHRVCVRWAFSCIHYGGMDVKTG